MRTSERPKNLFRVFVADHDEGDGERIATKLLHAISHAGFAGATVTNAWFGYGGRPLMESTNQSFVIDIVDDADRTDALLAILDDVPDLAGLVVIEQVRAIRYTRPTS